MPVKKLVGVYEKLVRVYKTGKKYIHLQASIHEILAPPIQQSDWSEFTSHGTPVTGEYHSSTLASCCLRLSGIYLQFKKRL